MSLPRFLLITPARNEGGHLSHTIASMLAQTVHPEKWVIVNDGSSDDTADVIDQYTQGYDWIERIDMPAHRDRSFAAKAHCFNAAYRQFGGSQYAVVGNLDADVTFEPDYLSFLLERFAQDPELGVAGTPFIQDGDYDSTSDSFEGEFHVSGGCQLFRRECFEDIGGYVPIEAGGVDWIAVTTARMKGWHTRSFRDKRYLHHRTHGTAERSNLSALYSYGQKDYSLGGSPIWQLFRVMYRSAKPPYVVGGFALGLGFLSASLRRIPRPVSSELMRFHRQEQMSKLRAISRALVRGKKVDNFTVLTQNGFARQFETGASAISLSEVERVVDRFAIWLQRYGETSWDYQTYFASSVGGRAKSLYYRHKKLGTLAVAPMIFSEAVVPSARRFFAPRFRFPIADAHFAMGFALLSRVRGDSSLHDGAVDFLEQLEKERCPGYQHQCWGYPFNWETLTGTIVQGTPLITTTPYVYEAFREVYQLDNNPRWRETMASIARHAAEDIKDFPVSKTASTSSYTPFDKGGVVNASAYRAFLLTQASVDLDEQRYWNIAQRNLSFVLESQRPDGSWVYAMDGVRNFVDHFHTCFILKALTKIHQLKPSAAIWDAIERGTEYYIANLFSEDGLPRPFAKAPRMTVYRRELYDYAECINLCILLRDRIPAMNAVLERVLDDVLTRWVKPDGSFRSRQLWLGWDNVPMHRWAQSQMFRSLCLLVSKEQSCGNS